MNFESTLHELGIPSDPHDFVAHLGGANLPWKALSDGLHSINKTFLAIANKASMRNDAIIDDQIGLLLQLPIGVDLPVTFAEPLDPQLASGLKSLNELTKILSGLCRLDLPNNLKIRMIRGQVHLYSIAANIPLGIGVLHAVANLRRTIDNIIHLTNESPLTAAEFRTLGDVIEFDPISFEQMAVGEIGFSFFRTRESDSKRVQAYQKKLCGCLAEFRANRTTFQIHDLRRTMHGKNRKANMFNLEFGRMGNIIFDLTFEVAEIPELLTEWLKATMQASADCEHPGSSREGAWGSMQISRQVSHVHSSISLASFFGKPLEYRIVTLRLNP